ncbi:hypothetical protein GGTG_13232 [Gaeumannomyces tritici R3-111a-1]|uniref:Pre-mRNA-splicing factor CWC24 n=1 Tax=Gaeumannomyces tritici (strain R3-111a-1) TaxID=644352 RepID=J3PIA4_GAET3|nr:hypothetical protein GGTG_13232 [Gaeumannomyces tritici R3-111a-1]EJT69122.1 hypothetical protein GGTG_13232 [Gaeumannomyces tritici R3-111a-1]
MTRCRDPRKRARVHEDDSLPPRRRRKNVIISDRRAPYIESLDRYYSLTGGVGSSRAKHFARLPSARRCCVATKSWGYSPHLNTAPRHIRKLVVTQSCGDGNARSICARAPGVGRCRRALDQDLLGSIRARPPLAAPKELGRAVEDSGAGQGTTNIRAVTVTDFAPDVCKDASAITASTYTRESITRPGGSSTREWGSVAKGKKNIGGTVVASAADRGKRANNKDDDDDVLLKSIPFACIMCREAYKQPVVTRCGHYFCKPCALKPYRKDPTCAAYGSGTDGVFNDSKSLQKLPDRKWEWVVKRR